jgi:hypothetical protein
LSRSTATRPAARPPCAFPLLSAAGAWPTSATLPANGDPAALLQARRIEDLRVTLLHAPQTPLADLVIDEAVARWQGQLQWSQGKINAGRAAVRIVATLPPEHVARQVARLAQRLDLPPNEVTDMLIDAVTGQEALGASALTAPPGTAVLRPAELVRRGFPNALAPPPAFHGPDLARETHQQRDSARTARQGPSVD